MKLHIQEELLYRLNRSFDRLEQADYTPASIFADTDNNKQWPGDYSGRVILALVQLARVTGRQPQYLKAIIEEFPQHLNERGYMGQVMPDGTFDEQQLAGHGWLVAGLLAHHECSGEKQSLELAARMVRELFRPLCGQISHYSVVPKNLLEGKYSGCRLEMSNGWQLSTDVGCVFIALEGLVPAYRWLREDWISELINETVARFEKVDVVEVSAQTHSTLATARALLAWQDLTNQQGLLEIAQHRFDLYRDLAMTENYANYNWFNRPEWTEVCAIVDSFILAVELWKRTKRTDYLELAQSIYYNALGYSQKPHGGYACECCVGPAGAELFNHVYDVSWCCNMSGPVGLSYAARHALLVEDGQLTLPFLFSFRAEEIESSCVSSVECLTNYPRDGWFKITVQAKAATENQVLRWFVPSWVDKASVEVQVNHEPRNPIIEGDFLLLPIADSSTSELEVRFDMPLMREPRPSVTGIKGAYRQRRGPVLMSECPPMELNGKTIEPNATPPLRPLNDVLYLTEDEAKKDRRRVLFSDAI